MTSTSSFHPENIVVSKRICPFSDFEQIWPRAIACKLQENAPYDMGVAYSGEFIDQVIDQAKKYWTKNPLSSSVSYSGSARRQLESFLSAAGFAKSHGHHLMLVVLPHDDAAIPMIESRRVD